MSYSEDNLIPLSYLAQYYYCKRRAALLLLEKQWEDNLYTAEGSSLHEKVHEIGRELRSGIARLQGVPLLSLTMGLTGKSDCIELIAKQCGYQVPNLQGNWIVYPVEYKHGRKRNELEYEVQLCAQGICLEEMWKCKINYGFLYYGNDKKRKKIELSEDLRQLVVAGAKELHVMLEGCCVPQAERTKKCTGCSIINICMPDVKKSATNYLKKVYMVARGGVDM
ncbi:MAG: CRISPR-associated protein Cas4 [Peptococcales bacterium]|jgi:CRISPR-associated exonuclease Cas4